NAKGIQNQYDPNAKDASGQPKKDQEIVRIDAASFTFPKSALRGSISTFTPPGGPAMPGLVVRQNGFSLGRAEIRYGGVTPAPNPQLPQQPGTVASGGKKIKIGSILELDDIRVGVQNFTVNFGQDIDFS